MKRLGTVLLAIGVAAAVLWQSPAAVQPPHGRGGRGRGPGAPVRPRKASSRGPTRERDRAARYVHALVIERLGFESGLYDIYIRTDSNIIAGRLLMTDGKPASVAGECRCDFFPRHQRSARCAAEGRPALVHPAMREGFVAGHTASTAFDPGRNSARCWAPDMTAIHGTRLQAR